jgi:hypothetical protein
VLIRVRVLKLFVKNRRQTNCIGVRWSLQSGADLFTYINCHDPSFPSTSIDTDHPKTYFPNSPH